MSAQSPKRAVLEGTLIVVSILVAFALDASWDEYQAARAEQFVLAELLVEFQDAERRIEVSIAELDTALLASTQLLNRFGPDAQATPVETVDSLLGYVLGGNTLEVPASVMNSLTASGEMRLVSDPVLRGELIGWPALVDDVRENHEWHRQLTDEILIPHLSEYVAIRTVLRPWHLDTITASETQTDVVRFRADLKLEGMLAWRVSRQEATRSESVVLLEAARRVVALLEDELQQGAS